MNVAWQQVGDVLKANRSFRASGAAGTRGSCIATFTPQLDANRA